jgi:hypothetical protein
MIESNPAVGYRLASKRDFASHRAMLRPRAMATHKENHAQREYQENVFQTVHHAKGYGFPIF